MNKYIVLFLAGALLPMAVPCPTQADSAYTTTAASSVEATKRVPVKILADYRSKGYSGVIDLGNYEELDDARAIQIANAISGWKGQCSCCMKPYSIESEKAVMMGRNMDLPNSFYPLYVLRTSSKGMYRTIGIGYAYNQFEPFDIIAETATIDATAYGLLPYACTDIMNEKGLVLETNMREGCTALNSSGTNPGKTPVIIPVLSRLIANKCATIEEALQLADNYNVYSPQGEGILSWHFAIAMMDATGRYGVLELINNKLVWNEGFPGNCNFWVDKRAYKVSDSSFGHGRWAELMKRYNSIRTMDDMHKAIQQAWQGCQARDYAQDLPYDPCTEHVNIDLQQTIDQVKGWIHDYGININATTLATMQKLADKQKAQGLVYTTSYITDPRNAQEMYMINDFRTDCLRQLPANARKLSGWDYISSISYTVNTQEKMYHVRFFEQDELFNLGFDTVKSTVITYKGR